MDISQRGPFYRLEGRIRGQRVRLSLRTKSRCHATSIRKRVEEMLAEGNESRAWEQLSNVLPRPAFQKLASLTGYIEPGLQVKPEAPTWGMLLAAFNAEGERQVATGRIRRSTKKRYDISLREFSTFLYERGISNLADITPPLIAEWKAWRMTRIQSKKQSRENAASLVHDLAALHKVFNYGLRLECDWVVKNPVRTEKLPQGEPNPWTADELQKMGERADGYELFIHKFLLGTGFRNGDACAVRWDQIDVEKQCIAIQTQKRSKLAWVPLGPETHFMLESERQRREALDSERVLLNRQGKPFSVKSLLRIVQRIAKRAGVKNAKVHRYRHTFISRMVASGASYADVGRMVGDSAATIEKFYVKFSPEWQQRLRRFVNQEPEIVGTVRAHSTRPRVPVN